MNQIVSEAREGEKSVAGSASLLSGAPAGDTGSVPLQMSGERDWSGC